MADFLVPVDMIGQFADRGHSDAKHHAAIVLFVNK